MVVGEPHGSTFYALHSNDQKSIIDGNDCDQYHVRVIDENGESTSAVRLKDLAPFKTGGYSKRKEPIYEDCQLRFIVSLE